MNIKNKSLTELEVAWLESIVSEDEDLRELVIKQIGQSKVSRETGTGYYCIIFEVDPSADRAGFSSRLPVEMHVYRKSAISLEAFLLFCDGYIDSLEIITPDSSGFSLDTDLAKRVIIDRIEQPMVGSVKFESNGDRVECIFYENTQKENMSKSYLENKAAYQQRDSRRIFNSELTPEDMMWLYILLLNTEAWRSGLVRQVNASRISRLSKTGAYGLKFHVSPQIDKLPDETAAHFEVQVYRDDKESIVAHLYVKNGTIDELEIANKDSSMPSLTTDFSKRCVINHLHDRTWKYIGFDKDNEIRHYWSLYNGITLSSFLSSETLQLLWMIQSSGPLMPEYQPCQFVEVKKTPRAL